MSRLGRKTASLVQRPTRRAADADVAEVPPPQPPRSRRTTAAAPARRLAQMVLASGSKSAATAGISETDEFRVTNSPLAADSSAESITSSTW